MEVASTPCRPAARQTGRRGDGNALTKQNQTEAIYQTHDMQILSTGHHAAREGIQKHPWDSIYEPDPYVETSIRLIVNAKRKEPPILPSRAMHYIEHENKTGCLDAGNDYKEEGEANAEYRETRPDTEESKWIQK